jgi:hypothetical protein
MDFLESYLAGKFELVWAELLKAGSSVREKPLEKEAIAVAKETMKRVRFNIETIILRLEELHYQFEYPEQILKTPNSNVAQLINELESMVGPIPLSLRMWYEEVGSVCFIGSHPNLSFFDGANNNSNSLKLYSDPLVIYPIEEAITEVSSYLQFEQQTDTETRLWITISPDSLHKANISGGDPYIIEVPDRSIDAPLLNTSSDTYFITYLRHCFQWACFPGLKNYNHNFAELDYLQKGLLLF